MCSKWLLLYLLSALLQHALHSANIDATDSPDPRQNNFIEWITSIFRPSTTTAPTTTAGPGTPQRECAECTCGTINTFHRIVGGVETKEHEYPWMAMLMRRGNFYCGGTLINDQYVLTAAHCVRGFNRRFISVRLLSHNRTDGRVSTIDRQLETVLPHEKYNGRNLDNDIALLRFSEPLELREPLRPACLPMAGKTFAGETAVVTGWGATQEGGHIADRLQEVQVPVMTQEACRMSKYGASRITENMLCAGYPEGGKDSCQGDSGGPLHVAINGTKQYQLAGVVSWGEGCARPNAPGVYTRVTQYLEWIEERTRDACKCSQTIAPTEAVTTPPTAMTTATETSPTAASTTENNLSSIENIDDRNTLIPSSN